MAFSQIGAACIIGAGIGGATGLYRGIKATSLADQTGKLRRTQYVFKNFYIKMKKFIFYNNILLNYK